MFHRVKSFSCLARRRKKFYYADCYLKDASAVKIVGRVTTRQNTVTGSEPASASSLYVSFSHFSREKRRVTGDEAQGTMGETSGNEAGPAISEIVKRKEI